MSETRNGLRAVPDPAAEDETVARLIRLAGRRPPVPEEDAATVKAAARAQWRWTVAAERRRARLYRGAGAVMAAAAAVLVVVASGLWQRFERLLADPVAVMASAAGVGGADFRPGEVVETAANAVALRMLAGDESVRVDAGSRVRFRSRSVLELERGAVYVDSAPSGSSLEVHTALAVVRHLGTQFEVRLLSPDGEPGMRVRVREGRVEVEPRDGELRTLSKGEGLAVTATAMFAEAVACHGPEWQWVTAARPPFTTRDRSVLEVLEWGAREGCWELELEHQEDRRRLAGVAVGSATLPDGRLEDALDTVLLGSSLGLRLSREELADGVFRVERR